MRRILSILGILIVAFMSLACDCEEEFLDEFDADMVVEGKVISIESATDGLYRIYVTTSDSVVEIYTPDDTEICGYPFVMGEDYIIFGYYNEEDNFFGQEGTYYTTLCSYTMSMEEWDAIMGE